MWQAGLDSQIFPDALFRPPTENVTLVLETAHIAKRF